MSKVINFPLYDSLSKVSIKNDKIDEYIKYVPRLEQIHHDNLYLLIYHHAVNHGNRDLYGAEMLDNTDAMAINFQQLPVELRQILAAYIQAIISATNKSASTMGNGAFKKC